LCFAGLGVAAAAAAAVEVVVVVVVVVARSVKTALSTFGRQVVKIEA